MDLYIVWQKEFTNKLIKGIFKEQQMVTKLFNDIEYRSCTNKKLCNFELNEDDFSPDLYYCIKVSNIQSSTVYFLITSKEYISNRESVYPTINVNYYDNASKAILDARAFLKRNHRCDDIKCKCSDNLRSKLCKGDCN